MRKRWRWPTLRARPLARVGKASSPLSCRKSPSTFDAGGAPSSSPLLLPPHRAVATAQLTGSRRKAGREGFSPTPPSLRTRKFCVDLGMKGNIDHFLVKVNAQKVHQKQCAHVARKREACAPFWRSARISSRFRQKMQFDALEIVV